MNLEFKRDTYKTTRGAYSRFLDLSCRVCGEKILTYQKDGPGNLRRLYFDRIFFPKKLTHLELKPLRMISALRCPICKEYLGTPFVYQKEHRKAFKVYQDAFTKKIRSMR